jgi:hypothetical protein
MVVMQTKDSPLFESAFFVLRKGRAAPTHGEMTAESNRIIGAGRSYFSRRRKRRGLPHFWLGFFLGGGAFALLAWIFL